MKPPCNPPPHRPPSHSSSGRWRLLLLLPIVASLWVGSYNAIESRLGGIPFFYWYQLLWVVLSAVLTGAVYFIER